MVPHRIVEGTGEEIATYLKAHPHERFVLTAIAGGKSVSANSAEGWSEALQMIESFRQELPTLSSDATSTESLYD